jgi:D-arginine dehydrogenase
MRLCARTMGRVVIIGGGIAGVCCAAALARRGREVILCEREAQLGQHSTGHSAAMFRLAVAEPVNVELGLQSRALAERLIPGGVVTALGGLYPCEDEALLQSILDAAGPAGVRLATPADFPAPLALRDRPAIFSPADGIVDVHALLHGLLADARAHGAQVVLGADIQGLERAGGRLSGVQVGDEAVKAEVVVDCTGAFSPELPQAPRAAGIRPHRRHLFLLDSPAAPQITGLVWDLTLGLYLRPESGGLLASPCDQTPMRGTRHVPADAEVAATLFAKLERWAPALSTATVRRFWAGLRPLTSDQRIVLGPEPRLPGLFRLGGFGGHGITVGPAAGEWAAAMLCGEQVRGAGELSPARFGSEEG